MISSVEGQESKIAVLWHQRGIAGKMSLVISAIMVVYHLLFISGTLARLGIYIMITAHAGLSLCFMLVIIFLTTPARRETTRKNLPWYDVVLILMSVAGAGYFFAFFDLVSMHVELGEPVSETLAAGRRVQGVVIREERQVQLGHRRRLCGAIDLGR